MKIVYLEKSIIHHPRTQQILQRVKPKHIIECDHYKEVFNPKNQNFRIQKQEPCLILAEKQGKRVFPSPPGFGIGGQQNYYFSHMLNCLYDCRYCFLQGMYSSANYVVFVNFEDFMSEMSEMVNAQKNSYKINPGERSCERDSTHNINRISKNNDNQSTPLYFFSGYDCDSLAFEPVTQFVKEFIPFFRETPNAILELRTKSTNVKELLQQSAFPNCVVAFSFTPELISQEVEHKVPSVTKRIQAMQIVAERGWSIGLRFDPLIYHPEFKTLYQQLVEAIFAALPSKSLHSISTGPLRFPEKMYQKIIKLYPNDPLLAQPLYRQGNVFSYHKEIEQNMKSWIHQLLLQYTDQTLLFECHV